MTEREWRLGPLVAAYCATFVGIGVARFAYAPLLPAMVSAGWLGAGAAGMLAAANLAGYLAGALLAPSVARRWRVVPILRFAMLAATLSMAPCAWPGGFWWFLPWRLVAGIAAGFLMVLVGPTVQATLPIRLRGLAGGFLFGGVGSGAVAGAVIVPALLPFGLSATWLALGAACLSSTLVAWTLWPEVPPAPPRLEGGHRWSLPALALIICYALCGIAAAPHMQWWPDYLARGLGQGTTAGAHAWLVWGLFAAGAPILFGRLGDRIGARPALYLGLVMQAAALVMPLASHQSPALFLSGVCAGATATGLSAVFLTRARELAGTSTARLWSLCTSSYAATQTGTGFFLAWLYTETGSHLPLFVVGLVATLAAFPFVLREHRVP